MLNKLVRGHVQRITLPLGRTLGRAGISADALTVAALPVVALGALLAAQGRLLAGGIVLVLGGVFDLFDGAVARATGSESRRGAFLDSTVDRLSDGMIFSAVAWHLAHPRFAGTGPGLSVVLAPHWPGVALALACLVLGFLTSYIRARAESLGFECNVGIAERAERVFIVAAGLILGFLVPALALLSALSLVTVGQRFVHVYRQAGQKSPA